MLSRGRLASRRPPETPACGRPLWLCRGNYTTEAAFGIAAISGIMMPMEKCSQGQRIKTGELLARILDEVQTCSGYLKATAESTAKTATHAKNVRQDVRAIREGKTGTGALSGIDPQRGSSSVKLALASVTPKAHLLAPLGLAIRPKGVCAHRARGRVHDRPRAELARIHRTQARRMRAAAILMPRL